jgi:hypothetical protein
MLNRTSLEQPSQPLTQADEIRALKLSTEQLRTELEHMRRAMNELRLSSSEKDAEIIRLTMHLQDQQHYSRAKFPTVPLARDNFASTT